MDEGRPFPLLPNTAAARPWEGGKRASNAKAAGEAPLPGAANGGDALLASHPVGVVAADGMAAVSAALAAERDRTTRLESQIRALVADSRITRREILALRVRRWRDEEKIEELETELARTRQSRQAAITYSRELARELVLLARRPWLAFFRHHDARLKKSPQQPPQADATPFYMRGFRLDEATVIVNGVARRARNAPSGTMVYGPYIALPAGRYCATVEARLYRFPAVGAIKVDVVCDRAQRLIEQRQLLLHPLAPSRRLEIPFTIWDGEDYADFEIRIWAWQGTALEVAHVDLLRLARGHDDDAVGDQELRLTLTSPPLRSRRSTDGRAD